MISTLFKKSIFIDKQNYAENYNNTSLLYQKPVDVEDNLRVRLNKFWINNQSNGNKNNLPSINIEFHPSVFVEDSEYGYIKQEIILKPNQRTQAVLNNNTWNNFISSSQNEIRLQDSLNLSNLNLPPELTNITSSQYLQILPTINTTNVFEDHTSFIPIPFDKQEIINNTNLNEFYVNIDSFYNFYSFSFEEASKDNLINEKSLPCFYDFSLLEDEKETNKISLQHLNLNNKINIKQNLSLLNKQSKKYFDKFGNNIKNFANLNLNLYNQILTKYENIIFPYTQIKNILNYESKKYLIPYCNVIEFKTDNTNQITPIFEKSKLSYSLLNSIIDNNINTSSVNFVVLEEQHNKEDIQLNKKNKNIKSYNITQWLRNNNITQELENGILLSNINDEFNLSNNPTFNLNKQLNNIILKGKIKNIVKNNLRNYKDILNGKFCFSETLFYKIEKIDNLTGEIVQNFYIPNSNKINLMRFIDSQIKYNKYYTYNIYNLQLVIGNIYQYEIKNISPLQAIIEVKLRPSIKLLEILTYTEQTIVVDKPPISPNVEIIPFKNKSKKIKFNLNAGIGNVFLEPILIKETDNNIFKKNKSNQKRKNEKTLEFKSDDRVELFEVYRTDRKPSSWLDFSSNLVKNVPTDVDRESDLKASNASFIDYIEENIKYYYTFRAVDIHGNVSNPTDIYEVELIKEEHVFYPMIKIYSFEEESKTTTKSMNNLLMIQPAFSQQIINEEASNILNSDGTKKETIIGKKDWVLGLEKEKIWGRQFKIRIKSKQTNKKIDINIGFTHTGGFFFNNCLNNLTINPPTTYSIGGSVSGLIIPVELALTASGQIETLTLNSNGIFNFNTQLEENTNYTVQIITPSSSVVTNSLFNSSGTVQTSNVSNILVVQNANYKVINYNNLYTPVVLDYQRSEQERRNKTKSVTLQDTFRNNYYPVSSSS